MIDKTLFDNYNGQNVFMYILRNEDIEVGITDYGAAIQYLLIRTEKGWVDVCLGYPTIQERIHSGTYCGATIGRVANRIKGASFFLNGVRYRLPANDGKNCNHGGTEGFDKRFFHAERCGDILRLTLLSRDGDQGFPGSLSLCVEFSLNAGSLQIDYAAVSDRDTFWSPTCHAYFNLNGEGSGNVLDHELQIFADDMTLADREHIPTGGIAKTAGTPFDFTFPKAIGKDIGVEEEQLLWAGGYDHNFVLKDSHAASVFGTRSGIRMEVYTDLPGLQFYSGNGLGGKGKRGEYRPHDGFCLEPQFFPDAVHLPGFAVPSLKANSPERHFIRYVFNG